MNKHGKTNKELKELQDLFAKIKEVSDFVEQKQKQVIDASGFKSGGIVTPEITQGETIINKRASKKWPYNLK